MKTKLLQYGITTLVLALFSLAIMFANNLFSETDSQKVMKILTDAFFAPGIIAMCFGLLIVASNGGTFHILSYGMQSFINLFVKDRSKIKYKTYFDYKQAMSDNKKPFGFILLVGLVFVAISMIFMIIWLKNK